MDNQNLIIIILILFMAYKMFYSEVQENMDNTHIPNMMSLQKLTNQKFPHYKKNQTYFDKIEKPHTDLDQYFTFNNFNKKDYQNNRLTTSEIENDYFFKNFNSSINNDKVIQNPNIDDLVNQDITPKI